MDRIESAWQERPIIWLTGVRRVGKTTLAKSLTDVVYFDCELPRVRQSMADPELFLQETRGKRLILDEVHRLENPSELLKISADHFPDTRILATGASTLGASDRFRDTLAGRKREVHLCPVLFRELPDFNENSLLQRLRNGGLPENLLAKEFPESDYAEWLSAYWARDIQERFRLEKRSAFLKLFELLLAQSGQLCELNSMTSACGASRTTLVNYLGVLEATGAVHVLKPFAKHPQREIIAMPKVYGFDTGFVCFQRGWRELRPEDLGLLWEHIVLDELITAFGRESLFFWRDKQKREVDFVLARRGRVPIAIECKWRGGRSTENNFSAMRLLHPEIRSLVVAGNGGSPRKIHQNGTLETGLGSVESAVEQLMK